MKLKRFIMPEKLDYEAETATESYTKFIIAPLEKGWGNTIGNSLRRALLSSVQGAAVTQVRIDGVAHEFSTIEGVVEDVPEIMLNIKKLRMRFWSETPKLCYLHAKGKREFTAKDLTLPPEIVIANPDQKILTISNKNRAVNIEMLVENGRGYVKAERLKKNQAVSEGTIFLDAFFSPVKKVNYWVESMRVLERTDFERVVLEAWTDGSVRPDEALIQSATILKNHMSILVPSEKEPEFIKEEKLYRDRDRLIEVLAMDIEELELSNRALNCLKKGRSKRTGERISIQTVGDLVQRTEKDMLDIENFGRKSLEELKKVLEDMGLTFGMDISGFESKE
ncbi:DNA-directed RNA polymerase subunit alpha [candidate division WOR-3 bacterium JGI_Cruoil_03_51_56]|uniref:DNA-directed RNA polymerase subunit alpha n=1 Tax=candidate division WOR-3 bacterium JGI_Cruoil_03_51_56 TaxID=1973747 RepID=A0A235BQS6_UNCW3|nr:MAG: DNA-directed RNA polymerase subunit alpha [candidate division WOR-3 bacterium JGI_Cruoil_03_51_56]